MKKPFLSLAALALLASPAAAHPAHHDLPLLQSLAHLLTEPDHLAMLAVAAAGIAFVAVKLRKRGA